MYVCLRLNELEKQINMKKTVFPFAFVVLLGLMHSSYVVGASKVDYLYKGLYTQSLFIDSLDRTDEHTKLYMHCNASDPFCISPNSYLLADGVRYGIVGADNIKLNCDELIIPDSHNGYYFTLIFPFLPKNVKSFDYIEDDLLFAFRIFGITDDLKYYTEDYKTQIPKKILKANYSKAKVPEYGYGIGHTSLDVHLISPSQIDYGNRASALRINDLFVPYRLMQNEWIEGSIDNSLTIHYDFDIAGVQCVDLIFSGCFNAVSFYVEPEKNNEVWIDVYSYFHNKPYLYTNGRLDALNRVASYDSFLKNNLQLGISLYTLSPEMFIDTLLYLSDYNKSCNDVNSPVSKLGKVYWNSTIGAFLQKELALYNMMQKNVEKELSSVDVKRFFDGQNVINDNLLPFVKYDVLKDPDYIKYITTDTKLNLDSILKFEELLNNLEYNRWENYSDTIANPIGGRFYPNAIKYYYNIFLEWLKTKNERSK